MDSLTDGDAADTISFNLLNRKARQCEDHDFNDDVSDITMLNGPALYEEMKTLLNWDAAQYMKPKASDESKRVQRKKKRKRSMPHRRRKSRSRKRRFYRQMHCSMPTEETIRQKINECKHVLDEKFLKLPRSEQLLTSSFSGPQNLFVQHTSATLKFVEAMLRSQMSRAIINEYLRDTEDSKI